MYERPNPVIFVISLLNKRVSILFPYDFVNLFTETFFAALLIIKGNAVISHEIIIRNITSDVYLRK